MSSKIISRYKIVGDLIFLSGITGKGENTEIQARNIFYKIQDVLKELGALQDIVNATV